LERSPQAGLEFFLGMLRFFPVGKNPGKIRRGSAAQDWGSFKKEPPKEYCHFTKKT
jgi:hypothetical protein